MRCLAPRLGLGYQELRNGLTLVISLGAISEQSRGYRSGLRSRGRFESLRLIYDLWMVQLTRMAFSAYSSLSVRRPSRWPWKHNVTELKDQSFDRKVEKRDLVRMDFFCNFVLEEDVFYVLPHFVSLALPFLFVSTFSNVSLRVAWTLYFWNDCCS